MNMTLSPEISSGHNPELLFKTQSIHDKETRSGDQAKSKLYPSFDSTKKGKV
jgi:hypothetical protein